MNVVTCSIYLFPASSIIIDCSLWIPFSAPGPTVASVVFWVWSSSRKILNLFGSRNVFHQLTTIHELKIRPSCKQPQERSELMGFWRTSSCDFCPCSGLWDCVRFQTIWRIRRNNAFLSLADHPDLSSPGIVRGVSKKSDPRGLDRSPYIKNPL